MVGKVVSPDTIPAPGPTPVLVKYIEKLPMTIGRFAIASSVLVIIGWILNLDLLTNISPHWPSMKVNSALCIFFSGWALINFTGNEEGPSRFKWQIPATMIILIGGLTLGEYAFHIDLGIDELLINEVPNPVRTSHPGRMSPASAFCFLTLGLSFFLLKYESKVFRHPYAHFLAMIIGIISLFIFLNYVFRAEEVMGLTKYTQMAFHTSVLLSLLAIGIFFLKLNHSLFSIILSPGPGGIVSRYVSLAGVIFPIILGILRVQGERREYFPLAGGTALFTAIIIAIFLFVAWGTAILVERKEDERIRLLKEQQSFKIQDELREQFISIIAHDLRTPLTAAKMGARMIERKLQDTEATKSYVKKIAKQLDRSDLMIRDLLDMKKISEGIPLAVHPEEIELCEFFESVVEEMELIHGEVFQLTSCRVHGYWDRDYLRRIVENLANNAVKYGTHGHQINLSASQKNDRVELSVHNDGPPIDPKDRKRLFELFERSDTTRMSAQQGWGIGLAIVSALAEAMNGKVTVESSEKEGTTFTVDLPLDVRSVRS